MKLFELQGRAELPDRKGIIKERSTRVYVVAESEESAIAAVDFEVQHLRAIASTDSNELIREKLIITSTKSSKK